MNKGTVKVFAADDGVSVRLTWEKPEGYDRFVVYFRREDTAYKPLLTTEKSSVRVSGIGNVLCFFKVCAVSAKNRTITVGETDNACLLQPISFLTMGSENLTRIFDGVAQYKADSSISGISPLTAFFPNAVLGKGDSPDFSKTVDKYIESNKADYFILDFYGTAINSILKIGDSFVTAQRTSGNVIPDGEPLPKILPREVYAPLLDIFIARLKELYDSDKIILVRTVLPELFGIRRHLRISSPRTELNKFLGEIEHYFIKRVNPIVIDLSWGYFGDLLRKSKGGIIFDRFYFSDCRRAIAEIVSGGGSRYYLENDNEIKLDKILYYYDNAAQRGFLPRILDRKKPAELIMRHTSREFIAENRRELIEIMQRDFSGVTDVYKRFDFGDNYDMKKTVRVISALESNTLQKLSYSELCVLFDKKYRIKRPIANFIRATLESALGCTVAVNDKNLHYMARAAYDLWDGNDPKSVADRISEYTLICSNTSVDIWGGSAVKEAINRCHNASHGCVISQNPFIWAFSKPIAYDKSLFSNELSTSEKVIKDALDKKAVQTVRESPSKWIAIDFTDITLQAARYNGGCFAADRTVKHSAFFGKIKDNAELFYLDCDKDRELITKACRNFAAFLSEKYGGNIILSRIKLCDSYRDFDGNIKPLKADKRFTENAQRLITLCEECFMQYADCYTIDISGNYISDDSYPLGGAGAARYEDMFYSSSADYIDFIVRTKPDRRSYDIL